MGLFKRLTGKPWLDENPNVAEPGAAPPGMLALFANS